MGDKPYNITLETASKWTEKKDGFLFSIKKWFMRKRGFYPITYTESSGKVRCNFVKVLPVTKEMAENLDIERGVKIKLRV